MTGGNAVLLVEDEAFVALETEDMLGDMGFSPVTVCASYEETERALDENGFPIAVFDLNLRGKRSTPLIRRALAKGCRVIVTTGYERRSAELDDLDVEFVSKPYASAELLTAIRRATGEGDERP
ncbi:MAG: response regulator [Hasllibacter sp.]